MPDQGAHVDVEGVGDFVDVDQADVAFTALHAADIGAVQAGAELHITASIGATTATAGIQAEQLLQQADEAMYNQKRDRRKPGTASPSLPI